VGKEDWERMNVELKKAREIVEEVLNGLPKETKVEEPELVTELKQAIESSKKDNVEREVIDNKKEKVDSKREPVIQKTEERKTEEKKAAKKKKRKGNQRK